MIDEHRAHELLGRLLAVETTERAAWLARELPDDAELCARLLAAVNTQLTAGETTLPNQVLRFTVPETPARDPMVGQRLGAFVVDARLPEQGGMGTVYRGSRADGTFEQDVAVKVIARGRDTDSLLRRFIVERRVLGWLHHPNIVRILDAGAASDGRPFLVMEWVDGLPLDRFCAERQLTLARRLELFRDVCAAVQYAHQHLVVHRDLKPSNVLVTPAGAPMILDFGLAKVLDDEADGGALISRTGERAMTPAYASPEQVRGEPITTATDVYALGTILYELLTGVRPYRFESGSATELARLICEQEPELPSRVARVREVSGGSVAPIASQRLRGELDAIVMRALEKRPAARYPTAAAFSEDLTRYLDGRPVIARRATLSYRSFKFVKRHAKALTASAAAVALAAVFVTQNVLSARRLAVERDRAEASLQFLVSLFDASDPDKAKGDSITAGELLDRGAKRLEAELKHQPATRASLLFTIGNVYDRLGRYDAAEPLLTESLELRRSLSGNPSLELADVINALGRVNATKGDSKEAERLYSEALEIRRKMLSPDDPLIARSLNNLATLLIERGDLSAAEALYRQAYEILRSHDDPNRAQALMNLSAALYEQGKYTESLSAARDAMDTSRTIHGLDNAVTLTAMSSVGWALFALGDYVEAERLQREVVAGMRRILGEVHPRTAEAWYSLGVTRQALGQLDKAEEALRSAEAVWRGLPGKDEHRAAFTITDLASVLAQKGAYKEAEALHREALDMRVRRLGENHADVGQSLYGLGDVFYRSGQVAEAEKYFRMDLELLRKLPGTLPSNLAFPEAALGRLLTERGRLDEAESLLRHALEGLRRDLPAGHPRVAFGDVLLGDWLARRGRLDEAAPLLRDGVKTLREKKSGSDETLYAEGRLAALRDKLGGQAAERQVSLPAKP